MPQPSINHMPNPAWVGRLISASFDARCAGFAGVVRRPLREQEPGPQKRALLYTRRSHGSQEKPWRVTHCESSHPAPLGHRKRLAVADDEVIQYPDIHQRKRVLEAFGQHAVGLTRLGYTRRMVV